ncbi:reverse transcriptase domain-containing protein [Microbacterium sp. LMI1-1-1.1]|uniref:reverse transcriptase domain-containing protein n=1 Tax=Microbacterium sp. LMI1-1-1.1 TaxID=3135223 RepID=UPI0034678BF8
MPIDTQLLDRLDLKAAIDKELSMSNRLMPRRPDRLALSSRSEDLRTLFRNRYRRGLFGDPGYVVFIEKNRPGRRPITEMSLSDRVLFRALVDLIAESLPPHIVKRTPNADFKKAPVLVPGTRYVSKSDVASYYEYVDHNRLAVELEGQTGEATAVAALIELLGAVMGRRVGLPQVHQSSDILGDTYIDPARRRLRRAGYHVTTYADDFRIASATLADARAALEACAREVRTLGLTLNESKTFTYTSVNYLFSLDAFAKAEKELFEDVDGSSEDLSLLFLSDYSDEAAGSAEDVVRTLAASVAQPVLEDDVLEAIKTDVTSDVAPEQVRAAERAWELWLEEDGSEERVSTTAAAISETLLERALPILGRAGNRTPLDRLSVVLRFEPALTPQVTAYIVELGKTGPAARTAIRRILDALVEEASFSDWQKIWLAEAAGSVRPARTDHSHYEWLERCVSSEDSALAATAAAALGRLRRGDAAVLGRALDRVGPAWRTLVLTGMAPLDFQAAEDAAEDRLERILLEELKS